MKSDKSAGAGRDGRLQELIWRIVTGDGGQVENLALTDDEWRETAKEAAARTRLCDANEIMLTLTLDDWLAMVQIARVPDPLASETVHGELAAEPDDVPKCPQCQSVNVRVIPELFGGSPRNYCDDCRHLWALQASMVYYSESAPFSAPLASSSEPQGENIKNETTTI